METAEICDDLSADHNVVEVSHDEICVRQVNS